MVYQLSENPVAQTHSLPLYVQISEMLIRDIQAGRLMAGERLPPEREMAVALKTSVGTLRKSLADLTKKGMLERRQGSGNYVTQGSTAESVYAFFRLELVEGGGLPTAEVLSVDTLRKPDDLPQFGESVMAHRIRRLRRLNGRPAALEEIWLDGACIEVLSEADLSESMYLFYKDRLGVWIQCAEDQIGLGAAPAWGLGLFPKADDVMCQVDRLSWDQRGQSVEFSRTWYDSEHVRYISRIK